MKIVNEKSNASNLTRYYRADDLTDSDSMIQRLCEIRTIENLNISYIKISDLMNRSNEGSDSLRLPGDVQIDELIREVHQRNIDVISLSGTFLDKPIVIGAKLSCFELFITVRLNNRADIGAIEKELSL